MSDIATHFTMAGTSAFTVSGESMRLSVLVVALMISSTIAPAQTPLPGTYRLFLCASVCALGDSARAVASAVIVIADDSLAGTTEWRLATDGLREPRRYPRPSGRDDNVCFKVVRTADTVNSEELYFGIGRNGRTRWERTANDGYSMLVYQSPDASYTLTWSGAGELIQGEGWSFGWQPDVLLHRNAFFVASRISTPRPGVCK